MRCPETHRSPKSAFTLIELSIVLVIIGLIIGGILVGQDLIKNAEVRAQVTQIENYNSAVNTFRGKFAALPGDMPLATANQFGFVVTGCNGAQGWRDGNGLIEGKAAPFTLDMIYGENQMFWVDLSSATAGSLIKGQFPNSGAAASCSLGIALNTTLGTTYIGDYIPDAKIGHGNFIYVYAAGSYNWYGLSAVTAVSSCCAILSSGATIPVVQAYNMDKKVDDGLPATGIVQAVYINGSNISTSTVNAQTTDSTTSCYNTTNNVYSISSLASYGANGNCALSFRFQ